MSKIISGIQQVGIGIPHVHQAWDWYRRHFAVDVPVFEEAAAANLMLPYTGGQPRERHAILALSMQGGGGFEIWQYRNREPLFPSTQVLLGDLGINICKIKCHSAHKTHRYLTELAVNWITAVKGDPDNQPVLFTKDPWGNIFQMVESDDWFVPDKKQTGGVEGVIIGVSDIDKSMSLYRDVLGYDKIIYDVTGVFDDLREIPGGKGKFRRILLTHSNPRKGGFSQLLTSSEIELIQCLDRKPAKIFEGRFWGDIGFIHLCFDVVNMTALKKECETAGFPFTVDSANSFDMGEAAGHFSYIEDPDGTLIEFVETHKIPIFKKIGWYLDLRKRDASKPLPKWMLRSLALNRKKD